ncbi:hypothetical protein EDC04DRAFT_2580614 [Pisolithus marmoratus]|nr:hypothetical protein EDC04DRAFT_2580614 [Pisolithus marmoratus]
MADLRGSIDFLPGWYQQGHGVRYILCIWLHVSNISQPKSVQPGEEVKFHPEVSQLLKSGRKPNGMQQWVDQMSHVHALLSGMLAVIHLQMFAAGWEALIWLGMEARRWEDMDMSSILQIWTLVYNCVSIMVNHTTPYHTDINGWEPWLDMLMMVGDYTPLDMVIPMLKLWFRYNPGTIITMSGLALEHGVGYSEGNRACLAYYMQQNIHQSIGVLLCNLPHISDLQLHSTSIV